MKEFIIKGGKPLLGKVKISGSKNAALPCIAATTLAGDKFTLKRVPRILDVEIMIKLVQDLGATCQWTGPNELLLDTTGIKSSHINPALAYRLRASILLAGPLLSRFGEVKLPHPGGCLIGQRSIEAHLSVFKQLGCRIKSDGKGYFIIGKPKGDQVVLDEISVTATENALMASSRAPSVLILGAASEPHMRNLAEFLGKIGVQIKGAGSYRINIAGKNHLKGTTHEINPDEVEAGSFMAAALATGGKVRIEKVKTEELAIVSLLFDKMGAQITKGADWIEIGRRDSKTKISPQGIQVGPWPRIPTDLQPPLTVLTTQAEGESLIHDWMYERRFGYVEDLKKMGAEIIELDSHRIKVRGPAQLKAALVTTPDIRAGFALVLAGLVAKGTTRIQKIELIERGYENLALKLKALGAQIEVR